jgi:hypothetical protein
VKLDRSLAHAQTLRDVAVAEAPFRATTGILPGTPARARKGSGSRDKPLRHARTTTYSVIEETGASYDLLSQRKDLWELTGKNLWIFTMQNPPAWSTVKPPWDFSHRKRTFIAVEQRQVPGLTS